MSTENTPKPIDLRRASPSEYNDRMSLGASKAARDHREAGRPVVTWDREGRRVVIIPPDRIILPGEPTESRPPS